MDLNLNVFNFIFLGTRFKKVITNLEESLEIKTTEAQHLTELVAKMESSSSSDEMNKVQIGKKDALFALNITPVVLLHEIFVTK